MAGRKPTQKKTTVAAPKVKAATMVSETEKKMKEALQNVTPDVSKSIDISQADFRTEVEDDLITLLGEIKDIREDVVNLDKKTDNGTEITAEEIKKEIKKVEDLKKVAEKIIKQPEPPKRYTATWFGSSCE